MNIHKLNKNAEFAGERQIEQLENQNCTVCNRLANQCLCQGRQQFQTTQLCTGCNLAGHLCKCQTFQTTQLCTTCNQSGAACLCSRNLQQGGLIREQQFVSQQQFQSNLVDQQLINQNSQFIASTQPIVTKTVLQPVVISHQEETVVKKYEGELEVRNNSLQANVITHQLAPIVKQVHQDVIHEHHQDIIHEHHKNVLHEHHQQIIHEYHQPIIHEKHIHEIHQPIIHQKKELIVHEQEKNILHEQQKNIVEEVVNQDVVHEHFEKAVHKDVIAKPVIVDKLQTVTEVVREGVVNVETRQSSFSTNQQVITNQEQFVDRNAQFVDRSTELNQQRLLDNSRSTASSISSSNTGVIGGVPVKQKKSLKQKISDKLHGISH